MELGKEVLFFFSGLGGFNGLILGLYFLFFAKEKGKAQLFLGILLIAQSLRIGKAVLLYFDPETSRHILQIGLSACFLIGPALYMYLKQHRSEMGRKMDRPLEVMGKSWISPLTISLVLILIVGLIYPYKSRPDVWNPLIVGVIYAQWFWYTMASFGQVRDLIEAGERSARDKWILSIYFVNLAIMIAYFLTFFFGSMVSYISAALIFSAWTYWMIFHLFVQGNNKMIFAKQGANGSKNPIDAEEAKVTLDQLDEIMRSKSVHKQADLKLADLSAHVKISPHKLSQLLNEHDQGGFSAFINRYRIEDAKTMISRDEHLTLEAIGYEVGFNSKSAFYTAFKKETGTTPSKYKSSKELVS